MALVHGEIPSGDDGTPIVVASMAKEIENAFLANWAVAMGNVEQPKNNKQMQLLFVAVAKGVINHLKNNPLSITITDITSLSNNSVTGKLTINS